MKKLLSIAALLIISCNNQPDNHANSAEGSTLHVNTTDTVITNARPIFLEGCYQMTFKKDTAFLKLELQDSTITGYLTYKWHQKDWNKGTIKGVIRNDKILADYHFESEGLRSVREVIFKIRDTALWQANGQLEERNGKIVFRDPSNLHYDTLHPFFKLACP